MLFLFRWLTTLKSWALYYLLDLDTLTVMEQNLVLRKNVLASIVHNQRITNELTARLQGMWTEADGALVTSARVPPVPPQDLNTRLAATNATVNGLLNLYGSSRLGAHAGSNGKLMF